MITHCQRCGAPFSSPVVEAEYCSARCTTLAGREAFMMGVGRVKARTDPKDIHTRPLFPLWLILDADGTLAAPLRGIVERTQA